MEHLFHPNDWAAVISMLPFLPIIWAYFIDLYGRLIGRKSNGRADQPRDLQGRN